MDTHSQAKAALKPRLFVFFCLWIGFAGLPSTLSAQENPLNRKITVDLQRTQLDDALYSIGDAGGFDFSYNPEILPTDSLVTVSADNTAVKNVMEDLLGKRMQLRPVGNHVVIRKRKPIPLPAPPPLSHNIDGYLIDQFSGEKIHFATVFENYKRTSTLSDTEGHYDLEIPGEARQVALSFSKRGYRDTVIVIRPSRQKSVTVGLAPIPGWDEPLASREVNLVGDMEVEELPLVDFLVPEAQQSRAVNVLAALRSFPFQISLVPSIGTNLLMSGAMNNHISLNILAGYSHGVRGVDVGGLINIDREHVKGVQAAGIGNIVGGELQGIQGAGIFNHVRGDILGVQAAGIYNRSAGEVVGVQAGGIGNISKGNVRGVQVGGIFNRSHENVNGIQLAGIMNSASGDVRLLQVGGIFNRAGCIG
ncbi:MAG: hypothetical protein AAF570_11455, partial [Bacteroidota bacterium]